MIAAALTPTPSLGGQHGPPAPLSLQIVSTPNNTTATEQNHSRYNFRASTRGATARLNDAIPTSTLKKTLSSLFVNTEVQITIKIPPMYHDDQYIGRILACDVNGSRLVRLTRIDTRNDDEDDTTIALRLPFESNDPRVISNITVIKKSVLNVPITRSNGPLRPMSTTIFMDGGARPNPGPSAAAIAVRRSSFTETSQEEVHSHFYQWASNNIGEMIAAIAALRMARRLIETEQVQHINLVTDSATVVYNSLLNGNAKFCSTLAPLVEIAKPLYHSIFGYVTWHTMDRQHGNPADKHATKAIATAAGTGDATLFVIPTVLPKIPQQTTPIPLSQPIHLPNSLFEIPKSFDEFALLRQVKTRNSVPPTMVQLWAPLVKHYLALFLAATTQEAKASHAIRIITLPHLYLPKRVGNSKILASLSTCVPIVPRLGNQTHATEEAATRMQRTSRHDVGSHRISEAINRMVADRKLRTANNLLQSQCDGQEATLQQKIDTLKSKLIPINPSPSSFPMAMVPMISTAEFNKALYKTNRQASNAIDGWSKDLLLQACEFDSEISTMFAQFLHFFITAQLPYDLEQMVLMARGVAIPKGDSTSSWRPICVSTIFLKLLGNIALARDGGMPSEMQYAIGTIDGHVRIIHKIRNALDNHNITLLRFDVSNAFGCMPRSVVRQQIAGRDETLKQYFRLVYGHTSKVAAFGDGKTKPAFVDIAEGVKQGDSTSAMLFCHGLDRALRNIKQVTQALDIQCEILAYMDDITVTVASSHASRVFAIVSTSLQQIGLTVNPAKSHAYCRDTCLVDIPNANPNEPFVILGANVAESESARRIFSDKCLERQERYFTLLQRTPLHPQVYFTLLKICGSPRIKYHVSVTHPSDTDRLTARFDELIRQHASWILDPSGMHVIPTQAMHHIAGLGFPDYHAGRHELYASAKKMTDDDLVKPPPVVLTLNHSLGASQQLADSQLDAQWLFFESRNTLSPADFIAAMAVRIGQLPAHLSLRHHKCNCGFIFGEDAEAIDHCLRCDMATSVGHSTRHNMVRDAIIDIARMYGITTTKEPTIFSYADGRKQRPDIMCHTQPMSLVTDVSLISHDYDISESEAKKNKTHNEACAARQSVFIPFVMHTRGTLGTCAERYIRSLTKSVIPAHAISFGREMRHAVSSAAARGRAQAVQSAAAKLRW